MLFPDMKAPRKESTVLIGAAGSLLRITVIFFYPPSFLWRKQCPCKSQGVLTEIENRYFGLFFRNALWPPWRHGATSTALGRWKEAMDPITLIGAQVKRS